MTRSLAFLRSRRRKVDMAAGFTLIELLAVMAIIAVLATLVISITPGTRSAALFNKNISNVASLLEQARQTAVTQNSYVYVGLLSANAANVSVANQDKPGTYVAAFISSDGTDVLRSVSEVQVGGGAIQLLDGVQKLASLAIEETLPAGNALSGSLSPAVASKPASAWSVKARVGSAIVAFDRIIKFTPQGAARIGNAPVEAVEVIVRPSHGGARSETEAMQAGVIRINGLTGKIDVHQPGA